MARRPRWGGARLAVAVVGCRRWDIGRRQLDYEGDLLRDSRVLEGDRDLVRDAGDDGRGAAEVVVRGVAKEIAGRVGAGDQDRRVRADDLRPIRSDGAGEDE